MRISSKELAQGRSFLERLTAAVESGEWQADDPNCLSAEADYLEAKEQLDRLLGEWEIQAVHEEVTADLRRGARQ